jgi:hypothetical protein
MSLQDLQSKDFANGRPLSFVALEDSVTCFAWEKKDKE